MFRTLFRTFPPDFIESGRVRVRFFMNKLITTTCKEHMITMVAKKRTVQAWTSTVSLWRKAALKKGATARTAAARPLGCTQRSDQAALLKM